jgi:glutamate synthase domain-containing protein 2
MKRSKTVKITGLSGQNYVAIGLNIKKQLIIDGQAGDFFGALNNGSIINLKGTARRFLGDTMADGGLIIQGNVQHGVGLAMTGGIIVVRGNVDGDIGQLMKGGTIIVSGNCGVRSGAYMFNGELIVAGNVGKDIGLNMTGGTIFVGGKIGSLGENSQTQNLNINDEKKLKKYFDHYGITKDTGEFKKIVPLVKKPFENKIFDTAAEPPNTDTTQLSWSERIRFEIEKKTENPMIPVSGILHDEPQKLFESLTILPLQTKPIKSNSILAAEIELSQSIGEKLNSPLKLDIPILLSSRGSGIVSKSCKMAQIFAASTSNSALSIGGGLSQEESELITKHKGKIIQRWSANRLGIRLENLINSNAIELELGQPGAGSFNPIIPSNKITPELSKLWQVPEGVDIFLPPKIFDLDVSADLKRHVELFREITEHNIPIFIKLCSGDVAQDVKLAIRAGADAIIIEGNDNLDHSIPQAIFRDMGLPSLASITQSVKAIKSSRADKRGVKLIISGLFRTGADVFKALAMGADAVALQLPCELAIGCTLCGKCITNTCPAGIATTDPELEIKLDWVDAGKKLVNFISTLNRELKLLMQLSGYRSLKDFDQNVLRALNYDTAAITGIPLAGFDKVLPMWEH